MAAIFHRSVEAVSVVASFVARRLCACQSRTHITVIALLYEGGGQRSLRIGPFLTRAAAPLVGFSTLVLRICTHSSPDSR